MCHSISVGSCHNIELCVTAICSYDHTVVLMRTTYMVLFGFMVGFNHADYVYRLVSRGGSVPLHGAHLIAFILLAQPYSVNNVM